jgi:hypothetical protein
VKVDFHFVVTADEFDSEGIKYIQIGQDSQVIVKLDAFLATGMLLY